MRREEKTWWRENKKKINREDEMNMPETKISRWKKWWSEKEKRGWVGKENEGMRREEIKKWDNARRRWRDETKKSRWEKGEEENCQRTETKRLIRLDGKTRRIRGAGEIKEENCQRDGQEVRGEEMSRWINDPVYLQEVKEGENTTIKEVKGG